MQLLARTGYPRYWSGTSHAAYEKQVYYLELFDGGMYSNTGSAKTDMHVLAVRNGDFIIPSICLQPGKIKVTLPVMTVRIRPGSNRQLSAFRTMAMKRLPIN